MREIVDSGVFPTIITGENMKKLDLALDVLLLLALVAYFGGILMGRYNLILRIALYATITMWSLIVIGSAWIANKLFKYRKEFM